MNDKRYMRRGTPVTVLRDGVAVHAKMREIHGRWLQGDRGAVMSEGEPAGFNDGTLGSYYAFTDEGIDWLRGHVALDDDRIAALKVACAIARGNR